MNLSSHIMWRPALALLLAAGLWSARAQVPALSPKPAVAEFGKQAFHNQTAFALKGADKADAAAVGLLRKHINTQGRQVTLLIGERSDKAVGRYRSLIPRHPEGYYLSITPDRVVIAGNDEAGTFYGVQTFLQLMQQASVPQTTITDWPTMPERGVIEGYYGNPYSHEDRLGLFDFMGENKMNVFVYGPKDDPYHRGRWREDYPAADAERMRALVKRAHANHVKFVWAIHPGGDIRWNKADSMAIVTKLEHVYRLGVRSFCVFFDDIGGEGARGEKQAALLNYINQAFRGQHKDVEPLMMCPTQYNKSWAGGPYLHTLGTEMDPSVRIMWTGATVVDMIDRADMEWINSQISRKAYIWLNYPVTDYCIDHLLMGKTYGNGRDIGDMVSGFCSNPMEYCEASKVSLFSIADYAWNPQAYDEDTSWELAIGRLMPEHRQAFKVFCENNVDLGATGHGLRRTGESPQFTQFLQLPDGPGRDGKMFNLFREMADAADELLQDKSRPALSAEIKPWVEVMKCVGMRGKAVLAMRQALQNCLSEAPGEQLKNELLPGLSWEETKQEAFIGSYLQYQSAFDRQLRVRSRDFDGSIKVASPVVATNYIEPWLRETARQLIDEYKAHYTYRTDVFPTQLLASGNYYIKVNGKFLTDPDYRSPQVKAEWVAERDTINPQSQEWTISVDAATQRYKVVNRQAERYLNEVGVLGGNAYSADWNTYVLQRQDGKFSIRNAGNGGSDYWSVSADGRHIGFNPREQYVFEFIPIE